MIIPRADEKSKEFSRSLLLDDPRITIRPMFGNISAFVNGNMFAGLFGTEHIRQVIKRKVRNFSKRRERHISDQ